MSSSYLPEAAGTGNSPVRSLRTAWAVRRGEAEVSVHEVRAAVYLAKEQTDCMTAAAATRFCLGEELSLLEYGRCLAGNDPASQALVGRKVAGFADRNDRRLTRKFG